MSGVANGAAFTLCIQDYSKPFNFSCFWVDKASCDNAYVLYTCTEILRRNAACIVYI